ncbi:MAG: bacteriorhodopsin [Candidatus Bathyarchaeota archaeon]|nr:MAG: bacteriorhodopsin [Candidatus Bathyarchaeota archaeon]
MGKTTGNKLITYTPKFGLEFALLRLVLISRHKQSIFAKSSEDIPQISYIMWFVLVTWSIFPLVWVLAPTGFGIIAVDIGALLYLALDIVTKIIFGIYVSTRD